ncbi:ribulose-bisphosphate carboxylase, partial [Rhodovulum sulfidophilum]|nr:ribulose-bisphosphate carboxylase [Rhodovulum sulfidophilum]
LIDPENGVTKIAYPVELFDRNIIDGRAMLASFLTLTIGNNQGMGDVAHAKMRDFYVPPAYLRLFDGPAMNIADMWRVLGRSVTDGGMVVGTIIKPKLGLRPQPFADACYEFWLGGDFIKNDEPQGNQVFAPLKETIRLVSDAMKRAQDKTGEAKLFSANITADDHYEMLARGEYILETFGENADHVAFLVDGYVAGPAAITTARRAFPHQFLHYHRAGHGAITSPESQRGYTAFVLSKMSRLQGASGIHTGTMGFGKMEGDPSDKIMAFMLTEDVAEGPFYRQEWLGMKPTTPIISGGMNALRLPGFFDNLGHSNVIQTSGGGAFGHVDGGTAGAISLHQD